MNKKKTLRNIPKSQILRIIGSLLSTILLVYLVVEEKDNIAEAIRSVDISVFLILLLLTIFSRFFIWLRWHILLASSQGKMSSKQSLRLFFAGLFASNFLPSTIGGDAVRFAGGVRMGFSGSIIASSLIMDRIIGAAGMAMMLPLGIIQLLSSNALKSLTGITGVNCMISVFVITSKLSAWVKKAFQSIKEAAYHWVKHPASLGLSFIATWGHMVCLYVTIWLIFTSLEKPISFLLIAGLWSASYFFTMLPISINGFGLQELSLTYLFVNYGHLEFNTVVVAALLIRILQTLLSLPGAFFLPGYIRMKGDLE